MVSRFKMKRNEAVFKSISQRDAILWQEQCMEREQVGWLANAAFGIQKTSVLEVTLMMGQKERHWVL